MQSKVSTIKLSEILSLSRESVEIDPLKTYKQITVRLHHKGVVLREEKIGQRIKSKQYLAKEGQFIISRIDARNGAMGLVPQELDGAIVTNDFLLYDVDEKSLFPKYFDFLTSTKSFVWECIKASKGTTNRVRLKPEKFLEIKISLPPLVEQKRVVVRIESFLATIKEVRRFRVIIDKRVRSLLLSIYTKITKEAKYLPMRIVAPLVRRPIEVDVSKQYYELGTKSFGKGTFHKPAISGAELGTKRIYKIEKGNLVFNNVFAWEGAVAVAKPEDHGRVGSHRFITCVPRHGLATSNFLCFHFLTNTGLEQLGKASPGGAGRNRTLGLKKLEKIQVPVPPIGKQIWFDSFQAKVDELKRLQAETEKELEELVPSILDKAFKGEL